MRQRTPSTSGLQVSALGLGCMGMSGNQGPPRDRQQMIALGADRARLAAGAAALDRADPGTTAPHRPRENPAAADLELTEDDPRDIDAAVSGITVRGERYPEWMLRTVGR
jgi:hypothetical protein